MLLSLVNASLNMGRTGLGVPLPRPCGLPALSGAFGKKWGFFDCWKGFSPCLLTSEGCQNCGEKSEMPKLKLVLLLMEVCSGQPRWVNGTDPAAGCVLALPAGKPSWAPCLMLHPLQTSLLLVFVCLLSCRSSFCSTPAPCASIYMRWARTTRAIPSRAGLSSCLALWGGFQPPRKKSSWQPVAAEMSLFKKQTVKLSFFCFLATAPGAQALRSAAGSPRPRVSHGN